MDCRPLVTCVFGILLGCAACRAQSPEPAPLPSAAQTLLQPPVVPMDGGESVDHHQGLYSALGVLIAPPIAFFPPIFGGDKWGGGVLPPIPSGWASVGYRRANDVSWQTSVLVVPIYDRNDFLFKGTFALTTVGLDFDRISTNRSSTPDQDLRWQVGLRTIGIAYYGIPIPVAMGPHAGVRYERPLADGVFSHGWCDVGLLPNFANGFPLLDLRAELGLTWRPPTRPGFSVSVSAFNEMVGIVIAGFMTPGVKVSLGWNF